MQLVVYFERLQKRERGKYRKQSCTTKLRYSVCIFDARFVHVVVCGFSLFAFFIAFKIFAAQVVVTPAPPITKRLRAQAWLEDASQNICPQRLTWKVWLQSLMFENLCQN